MMGEEDDERILITLPLGLITSTVIDPLWTAILSQAWKSRIRTMKVKVFDKRKLSWAQIDTTPVGQAEGRDRRSI